MTRTKESITEAWRGIPAHYIAMELTSLRLGSDWTRSSKGMMSDALLGIGHHPSSGDYTKVDAAEIAAKARARMEATQAETARARRAEARAEKYHTRKWQDPEALKAEFIALARSEAGQRAVKTEDWQRLKLERREERSRAIDKVYHLCCVNQYQDLEDIIERQEKEKADVSDLQP
jgi:hypothetical protein